MELIVDKDTITIHTQFEAMLMATVADLDSKLSSVDSKVAAVGDDVLALQVRIHALEDQVASGGGITQADLDPISNRLGAIEGSLDAIHAQAS